MLLMYCLLHIDMILPAHATFYIIVLKSTYRFINNMIYFSLSFSFYCINNHIISLKQPHLFICSALRCCLALGYFFWQYPPGVACKSAAHKKAYSLLKTKTHISIFIFIPIYRGNRGT